MAQEKVKAAPSNGPEPQTNKQTVEERQAELAPPAGVIHQGNEGKADK